MCGISGFVESNCSKVSGIKNLSLMSLELNHRGPDDQGIWFDERLGVGLAHSRLSVVDLSVNGHQPMTSHSGRYVIVYNGEIYNYRKTRSLLEERGASFKGQTDSEVLLEAIDCLGLENALKCSIGMFSFALWDKKEQTLTLACDRMGEKPLYYGWQGKAFLFGSELKALRTHPLWQGGVDRNALAQLLRYNYIPAPQTIHPDIYKLRPGSLLKLRFEDGKWNIVLDKEWWSFKETVESGINDQFTGSKKEAIDLLDDLLCKVIDEQRIADVPIGAFLSGGIDSSLIVGVMQSISSQPVRTFTMGYKNRSYDESGYAKSVAEHLGTEHEEWIITADDALSIIPSLSSIYDEPFSDISQIPTALIAQLASRHVTVSLSGDGGDELFGGYNRHVWAPIINKRTKSIPLILKQAAEKFVYIASPKTWDRLFNVTNAFVGKKNIVNQPGEKLYKIASVIGAKNEQDMYSRLVRYWPENVPVLGGVSHNTLDDHTKLWGIKGSFAEKMMRLDTVTYLPNDILVKVDRAAMHASLETRVPFLDHRIVGFSSRLPLGMKLFNGEGKWILRQVLERYVPSKLIDRPKTGFGVPVHQWLRGSLKDWAEDLLSESRLVDEGFFDVKSVRRVWKAHLSGKENNQYLLWSILMFQSWLSNQVS